MTRQHTATRGSSITSSSIIQQVSIILYFNLVNFEISFYFILKVKVFPGQKILQTTLGNVMITVKITCFMPADCSL